MAIKRRWCKQCDRHVGAVHQGGMQFGLLGLVLTLVTCGVWLLIWLFLALCQWVFTFRSSNWICPTCGSRV